MKSFVNVTTVAVARFCSEDSAIMFCTSGFVDYVMFSRTEANAWSRIKDEVMFRLVRQVAALVGGAPCARGRSRLPVIFSATEISAKITTCLKGHGF